MKQKAFTMLELVLVIVVLGILAALSIPRLDRDLKQEAADNVLSSIRYTQHLALLDNRHKFNDAQWQRTFWQIKFESCGGSSGIFLSIGRDDDKQGDLDRSETAIDPSNGKPMFWQNTSSCSNGGDDTVSENIFLSKKYGVTSVSPSGGCTVQHMGFDHLGRPHTSFSGSNVPNYSSYTSSQCTFTFNMSNGDSFQINIEPETGYAYIVGQQDS
jgi:prepilin-type N-terminal cleavage/methylation domain-containing protein